MITYPKVVTRFLIITGLVLTLLTGCAGTSQKGSEQISPGMAPDAVTRHLGQPARREQFAPDRFVYFYEAGPYADRPVCFDKHRVVHVGRELLEAWREARMALALGGKEGEALSQGAKDRVKATLAAERKARIAALERKVKPLPMSATASNLSIYRELLTLDPENKRYRRKVAFYQERHREEKTAQQEAARLAAQRRLEEERQYRNRQLRVYEGNDTVQMAVHELDGGALYIWLKNLSDQPLSVSAGHYRVVDGAGVEIGLRVGEELQGKLAAGGIAYGRLTYADGGKPHLLVFDHPAAGTIEKRFP